MHQVCENYVIANAHFTNWRNNMRDILKLVNNCMLCHEASCSKACGKIDPAKVLFSARQENAECSVYDWNGSSPCADCDAPCVEACPLKLPVKDIINELCERFSSDELLADIEPDISCDICGVKLENPFLLSSSVVASNYEMCAKAFEMGWAGAAFKTICLMDIHEASPRFSTMKSSDGAFNGFKNIEQLSDHSLEDNLECFKRLKANYPTKIIVASIMGRDEQEWEYLARKVEEAGADVVELNFSCPNMKDSNVGSDVGQIPELVKLYTEAARRGTKLPILAKMTPNITDMRVPARAAKAGGADGIAAINTIKSITGINIDTLIAEPEVHGKSSIGGYSGRAVKPIALRYIAEMANDAELENLHISGMGGIYTWRDALEFILVGSGSLQVTTSVMEYGYRVVEDMISGLKHYMKLRNIRSLDALIGGAKESIVGTAELERDTILFPKFNTERCLGCGRCFISCRDGGHQAIKFDLEKRTPVLNGAKCVGCHLCLHVCPNEAITYYRKRIPARGTHD